MAPKAKAAGKGKAKANASNTPTVIVDDLPDFDVNLADTSLNAAYYDRLNQAMRLVLEHPVFDNIVNEDPIGISAKRGDLSGGVQAPFNPADYKNAMVHGTYACAGNFFWHDLRFNPTPGVPIRENAVHRLMEHQFNVPKRSPWPLHIAVTSKDAPDKQLGAWKRVSPDEVAHALVLAVARDIERSEDTEVLQKWRWVFLTHSIEFHRADTHQERYFMSLQMREDILALEKACARTVLQRVFEVAKFNEWVSKTHGEIGAAALADLYEKNIRMASNSETRVTKGFVDSALTVHKRLLSSQIARDVMLKLDNLPNNPLESISKLQAIVSKGSTQVNVDRIMVGIWHALHQDPPVSAADLTKDALRGTDTNNKGFCDLILYKYAVRDFMFGKGAVEMEIMDSQWLNQAKPYFHTQLAVAETNAWRVGSTPGEAQYVDLLEQAFAGKRWDKVLTCLSRQSKPPAAFFEANGVAEEVAIIKGVIDAEKAASRPVVVVEEGDDQEEEDADGEVIQVKEGAQTVSIKVKALPPARRDLIAAHHTSIAAKVDNLVSFIDMDSFTQAELKKTVAGAAVGGGVDASGEPACVAILYDLKLSGEASSRPAYRTPPVQQKTVSELFSVVADRHSKGQIGGENTKVELHEGDMWFVFDGGAPVVGTQARESGLLAFFRGVDKQVRTLYLMKSLESLKTRVARVKTVNSISQVEHVYLITKGMSQLSPVQHTFFDGGSAGNLIGPVAVPPPSEQWSLPYSEKKKVLGDYAKIAVGGRAAALEADLDSLGATITTRSDTGEPVFFHSLPSTIFHELYVTYNAGFVVDLSAGDGEAAVAAFQLRRPYVGVTLSKEHSVALRLHVISKAIEASRKEGDPLYTPSYVMALTGKKRSAPAAVPKSGPKRRRRRGGRADREEDQEEGHGDDDAGGDAENAGDEGEVDEEEGGLSGLSGAE